jgi:hypothetical protein
LEYFVSWKARASDNDHTPSKDFTIFYIPLNIPLYIYIEREREREREGERERGEVSTKFLNK